MSMLNTSDGAQILGPKSAHPLVIHHWAARFFTRGL